MKNWKTTLAGVLGAAITAAITHFQTTGDIVNWQGYAVAATMAAVAVLAKDSNVTGGSVQQ